MATLVVKPSSIYEITQLEEALRRRLMAPLVPDQMLPLLEPPLDGPLADDARLHIGCAEKWGLVRLQLRARADDADPTLVVELGDMAFGQVELVMTIINDPNGERFDIDRMPDGRLTYLGTTERNLKEEERAMRAGLAPCQIRPGLRMFKHFLPRLEQFLQGMDKQVVMVDALTYYSAVLYERYGFGYMPGSRALMERIHKEFQPGGRLFVKLDGSTPFRQSGADRTVRGRAWAIHDGILNGRWEQPRMFKRIGMHAGITTFAGVQY